jgi:hypothetical protein
MLRGLTRPEGVYDGLGFRLRGLEMTRLETFVDAAFAFSVTMLALSPDQIPGSFSEMFDLFRGIPAFVFSLAMLVLFWHAHVVFSRRYGLDDGPTTVLSLAFIAVMLVYVYPLKFLATMAFGHYIPALRPAGGLSGGTVHDLSAMFLAMSAGFVLLQSIFVALHAHALRRADRLGLTAHERKVTRCEMGSSLVYAGVGVASVVLALVFRGGAAVVSAGFVYASLGLFVPLYWVLRGPSSAACEAARSGQEILGSTTR